MQWINLSTSFITATELTGHLCAASKKNHRQNERQPRMKRKKIISPIIQFSERFDCHNRRHIVLPSHAIGCSPEERPIAFQVNSIARAHVLII